MLLRRRHYTPVEQPKQEIEQTTVNTNKNTKVKKQKKDSKPDETEGD